MEYISPGEGELTFSLFHGDNNDYKQEFIRPLEEFLARQTVEKTVEKIILDFSKLSFISKRQSGSIIELVQTLRLLNFSIVFKNMRPAVSLAFAQWMPDVHQKIG